MQTQAATIKDRKTRTKARESRGLEKAFDFESINHRKRERKREVSKDESERIHTHRHRHRHTQAEGDKRK